MQVMNDGTTAQIKEIFAYASVASTPSLPTSDMGQSMFDGDSFSQLGSASHRKLPVS